MTDIEPGKLLDLTVFGLGLYGGNGVMCFDIFALILLNSDKYSHTGSLDIRKVKRRSVP